MSGIGEALAVIGAAAALVSACKDGGSIARQIAKRRKKKGAVPPTELLQKSLDKGQMEITAKLEEGSERFGVAFKNGDNLAVQALKDVIIEMQASLLRHLVIALEDDSDNQSFLICESSVTSARMRAINILNDLYQRQQLEAVKDYEEHKYIDTIFEAPVLPRVETIASTAPSQAPSTKRSQPIRKLFSKESRRNTTASITSTQITAVRAQNGRQHADADAAPLMTRMQTFPERSVAPEPKAVESRRNTFSTVAETDSREEDHSHLQISRRSTSASTSTSLSDSLDMFCKGAHYVQASPDSKILKLGFRLDKAASKTGYKYFWKCQSSKCGFEGVARQDENKQWQYDETERWTPHGIGYRWLFLAKSHIKSTSKSWMRQSRCLVCARGLGLESAVYNSDKLLFEHIARRHCGKRYAGVLMRGPICLDHNSIFIGNKETYDIFFPLECDEHPVQEEVPSFEPDAFFHSPKISHVAYVPSEDDGPLSEEVEDVFDNPWR